MRAFLVIAVLAVLLSGQVNAAFSAEKSEEFASSIYNPGKLQATASKLKVKAGDRAPAFTLRSVDGKKISLKDFRGKKNVAISFVPAAWTPVCSGQWPGYNLIEEECNKTETVLLAITVDNIPTLYAWTKQMGGVWFTVLSDFWPHGSVAKKFGVLRTDGVTERALFVIDKKGIVRYAEVTDINEKPDIKRLLDELEKLNK